MRALDLKLLRDLRRIWAQTLAIALVMACGVAVLVLAQTSLHTLSETRDAWYERSRFADVFASATRAPLLLAQEIAALPGVAQVETRITELVVLDMPGMAEPAQGRILSLPPDGMPVLNLPHLRSGSLPDPRAIDEVALSEPFAEAHGLRPGDRFDAIIGGRMRSLRVSGTVLSPEYIYTIGPASLLPDDRLFGVLWMGHEAAAAALDLDGAFNDVTLSLTRGADAAPVIAGLDRLLDPYGGTGAYGRDRQVSHNFLQQELDGLETMALILPPVFFLVSAVLVNLVLGRLIAQERQQIGLMKAVGYGTGDVALHYLKLSLGIGVAGVAIGWAAGWVLASAVTEVFSDYFRFPYLVTVAAAWPFVLSGVFSFATVAAGALQAVWRTVRLSPAVAMSPPAPPKFTRGTIDRLGTMLRLRQTTMMILRSITRWPGRAAVTLLGVAASVAVLVGSFFFFDAFDRMMDEMFGLSNRQHVTLSLSRPANDAALLDARNLPGVLAAEGGFALPVRLLHRSNERRVSMTAHDEAAQLARVLDQSGQAVAIPRGGIVLPEILAGDLDVGPGDPVVVELMTATRETHILPVADVVRQSLGEGAFIHEETLFTLLRTAPQVNRIDLLVDSAALPELYAQVKRTPAIGGVVLWTRVQAQFDRQLDETLAVMAFIYSLLGVLITVGVVYNAARIQLSERAHELASLRVLGFSRGEVGFVLVGEIMFLSLLGLPLGWLAGYGFVMLTVSAMSSEMFSIPFVVGRSTYAWAALIAGTTALASVLIVRRRLDRVDMVTALKQKE